MISNNAFKDIFFGLIKTAGLPAFVRFITRRKVLILIYHDPTPATLEEHFKYLFKNYSFCRLDLFVNAIKSYDTTILPHNSVIITLDDGHKNNSQLLPVFIKYGVHPTIYVCSQIIGTRRHFWFKCLPDFKKSESSKIKTLSSMEFKQYLSDKYGYDIEKEYIDSQQALSFREVNQMKSHVDFQSHTKFHPILPNCDHHEAKEEIYGSKKEIERIMGDDCRHFSYPNGDYSHREIKILQEAGYLSARTIKPGWNDINTDPYQLRAIGIPDNATVNDMEARLTCIPAFLYYVKHIIKHKRTLPFLTF